MIRKRLLEKTMETLASLTKRKRYGLYISVLALAAVLTSVSAREGHLEETKLSLNRADYSAFARILDPRPKAPDFSLKDLNGDRVELRDLRGKVVLVSFRATW